MKTVRIVISGGPGGGKSSCMSALREHFEAQGYGVITATETASELINSGISPVTLTTQVEFQTCLMKLQREKERILTEYSAKLGKDKVIMFFDRGMQDNRAYVDEEGYAVVLSENGVTLTQTRDSYDAVFLMRSPAVDRPEYYTTANNPARSEDPEHAAILDGCTINAWQGHKYLRVIPNPPTFDEKVSLLIFAIENFLKDRNF